LYEHFSRIHTFGFQRQHNDTLLRAVAAASDGLYTFIDGADNFALAFGDALGGLATTTAQNITVHLQAASPYFTVRGVRGGLRPAVVVRRPGHDEWAAAGTGTVYESRFGDLQSNEQRDLLVDVEWTAAALAAPVGARLPVVSARAVYVCS
jgi:hypothetical protein